MISSQAQSLLILEVDETLIHATEVPLPTGHSFTVGPYFVYRRPFLDEFLSTVAGVFQVAVWSSSTADYLVTIIDEIIPAEIKLQFVWGRDRRVQRYHPESQSLYWVKDLKKVKRPGFNLDRILFVDDTPQKLERNYGDAVYVKSFEENPNDQELRVLAKYLVSLAGAANVREIEKRGWRSRFH